MTAADFEKRVAPIWTVAAIAGTLLALGAGAIIYLTSTYASAEDLKTHMVASAAAHERIETRLGTAERSDSAHEALLRAIHEDYEWQRAQIAKIADRVGAPPVPTPRHAHQ